MIHSSSFCQAGLKLDFSLTEGATINSSWETHTTAHSVPELGSQLTLEVNVMPLVNIKILGSADSSVNLLLREAIWSPRRGTAVLQPFCLQDIFLTMNLHIWHSVHIDCFWTHVNNPVTIFFRVVKEWLQGVSNVWIDSIYRTKSCRHSGINVKQQEIYDWSTLAHLSLEAHLLSKTPTLLCIFRGFSAYPSESMGVERCILFWIT